MALRYFLKKWEPLNQELLEQQQESKDKQEESKGVIK
jgi:hypothetical protein